LEAVVNFCQEHWDMLRAAIEERGLMDLVATDGGTAIAQLKHQLEAGEAQPTNYDPLMSAMFAISGNAADLVQKMGGNALYIMVRGAEEEALVEGVPGYEGRTWPFCPLCHINLAHEIGCTDPSCPMDKERGYDDWINRAAEDQIEAAQKLWLTDADFEDLATRHAAQVQAHPFSGLPSSVRNLPRRC
jgi:hypothetical protein